MKKLIVLVFALMSLTVIASQSTPIEFSFTSKQGCSPRMSLRVSSNDATLSICLQNPFTAIKLLPEGARVLIKFKDNSVMELKTGKPSAPFKPLNTSIIPGKVFEVTTCYYALATQYDFKMSIEEAKRLASNPVIKWRIEIANGKFLDYNLDEDNAQKCMKNFSKSF